MNFYAFHLALSILFLLACCVCLFVLFRHIEIRKIEFQFSDTQSSTSSRLSSKHSRRDDAIVLLRVLLIVIFLVILMDEDKGTRWIMLVASYVVVTFLSLLFLAKSGNTAPSIRERKWEYLALFSVLVLLTGAAIALVKYSVLMLKYGKEYFGAARIIGYNDEGDDDRVEQNENQKEQNEEKNEEKDQEENHDENNEDNGENRRRLENEKDEGEDNRSGDNEGSGSGSKSADGESRDNEGDSGEEYAYIKVAWGGDWGCPTDPEKYCTANIETPCSQWDVDTALGSNSPADWKYWNGKVDGRLDNVFSCGNGFSDYNAMGDYEASSSPLQSDDAYPYAYIVGNCHSCTAKWAWTPYHKRAEAISGYHALFKGYMSLSVVAFATYLLLACKRQCPRKKDSNAMLLVNEGGIVA